MSTLAELYTAIDDTFPDNVGGGISAAGMRSRFKQLALMLTQRGTPDAQPMTRTEVRAIIDPITDEVSEQVYLTDSGLQGAFLLDRTDTTTADNGATVLVSTSGRRYKRVYDELDARFFGVKGTGGNDTTAIRAALAGTIKAQAKFQLGDYLSDAIVLPPTGWTGGEQNTQGLFYLDGGAGGFAGATLRARSGVAKLLTINNIAGVVIENLTLKGASDTQEMLDLSWQGTPSSGAAPANRNKLRTLWVSGGTGTGKVCVNLDQFHDSVIDGITIETACEWALSLRGGGGYWGASNLNVFGGKTRLEAQNAEISKSVFTKGLVLTGASLNIIGFSGCHFILMDDATIDSQATGNGTRSLSFVACYFNKSTADAGYLKGRFWSGATFRNCWFESGKLTQSISPAGGVGMPARFRFENCSFGSTFDTPVNCIYEFVNCTDSSGNLFSNVIGGVWDLTGGILTGNITATSTGPTSIGIQGSTPFISWRDAAGNERSRLIDTGAALALGGNQPLNVAGAWNQANKLTLGAYHVWVDSSGRLRIKSGAPGSDTDGTIIGTQS